MVVLWIILTINVLITVYEIRKFRLYNEGLFGVISAVITLCLGVFSYVVILVKVVDEALTPKCPKCKSGRLSQVDFYGPGIGTNIYECNECGEQFI